MYRATSGDLTTLLVHRNEGDHRARERVIPLVYQELPALSASACLYRGLSEASPP